MPQPTRIQDEEYARLLAVRTELRRFEHWSADRAAEQGLTASQHQLLLVIRGHQAGKDRHLDVPGPTIGEVADHLFVRHHTAVELADRTQELGLVKRQRDRDDHRVVRLTLTPAGRRRLTRLTAAHLEELARVSRLIETLLSEIGAA